MIILEVPFEIWYLPLELLFNERARHILSFIFLELPSKLVLFSNFLLDRLRINQDPNPLKSIKL